MEQATHTHSTSRRALLGAVAALPVAAVPLVAVASPDADAELLRLCAAFQERHRLLLRLERDDSVPDERFEAVNDEWWALFDRVVDTPAHTPEGRAAKAAMLAPVIRNTVGLKALEPRDRMALSLAADMGRA